MKSKFVTLIKWSMSGRSSLQSIYLQTTFLGWIFSKSCNMLYTTNFVFTILDFNHIWIQQGSCIENNSKATYYYKAH